MAKRKKEMNKAECEAFIRRIAYEIGLGFHPDTPMDDYINGKGEALFSRRRALKLQSKLYWAFEVLGEERIYQVLEPISQKQLKALTA